MRIRKLTVLLALLLMLCACKPQSDEEFSNYSLSVDYLNDVSALSLLCFATDDEVYLNPISEVQLESEFKKGTKDFIIAPTAKGVEYAKQYGNYSIMAVVTWGCYEMYSKYISYASGDVLTYGDEEVLDQFQEVLHADLGRYNFLYEDDYKSAVDEFITDESIKAILLAKPYTYYLENEYNSVNEKEIDSVLDLQACYSYQTDYYDYPVMSLFVNDHSAEEKINDVVSFVNRIKTSLNLYMSDKEELANKLLTGKIAYDFDNSIIVDHFDDLSIRFTMVSDCVNYVNNYLKLFDSGISEKDYIR